MKESHNHFDSRTKAARMDLRAVYRYLCDYEHFRDYIWFRMDELGFEHRVKYVRSKQLDDLKEFHDNIYTYYCQGEHMIDLAEHLCSDNRFRNFEDRLNFFMGLAMNGHLSNALALAYLVLRLSQKLMLEDRRDLVDELLYQSHKKLCSPLLLR